MMFIHENCILNPCRSKMGYKRLRSINYLDNTAEATGRSVGGRWAGGRARAVYNILYSIFVTRACVRTLFKCHTKWREKKNCLKNVEKVIRKEYAVALNHKLVHLPE